MAITSVAHTWKAWLKLKYESTLLSHWTFFAAFSRCIWYLVIILNLFVCWWTEDITLKADTFEHDVEFVNSSRTETTPATREQLEVLVSVKEITGALVVKTDDTGITDLSFLRNLRIIRGRQLEWVQCGRLQIIVSAAKQEMSEWVSRV